MRQVKKNLKASFFHFLRLIYPNNCILCNETLSVGEEHLCVACLYKLPRTNFHLLTDNPIEKRFWGKVRLEHASAYYLFEKGGFVQKLLHQIKYKGAIELADYLAFQIGESLKESEFYCSFDYIIPVPLHPNREKKRGYNQSKALADGLAKSMQVEVLSDNLIREKENTTQTKKTVFERWENTQGIFNLRQPEKLAGKHILLVDDVLTTGSTLEACVQALQLATDIKVTVFALATA